MIISNQLKKEKIIYDNLNHDKSHSLGINPPHVYCYDCKEWIK